MDLAAPLDSPGNRNGQFGRLERQVRGAQVQQRDLGKHTVPFSAGVKGKQGVSYAWGHCEDVKYV